MCRSTVVGMVHYHIIVLLSYHIGMVHYHIIVHMYTSMIRTYKEAYTQDSIVLCDTISCVVVP